MGEGGPLGLVSRIQHFSTGDGPGIRTTVFLQGCGMACPWCHNPETISRKPELLHSPALCSACGLCAKNCPAGAILVQNGGWARDGARCALCGKCVEICPADAIFLSGRALEPGRVLERILRDREFYAQTGGGATLSGGEPLLQPEFCAALAAGCQREGIPVLVDTAGGVPYSAFEAVLPHADMFYFDIKAVSEEGCRKKIGIHLHIILENLGALIKSGADVTVRVPVIPGHSDSPEFFSALSPLLLKAGAKKVHLLPFHPLGAGKYRQLDRAYEYENAKAPEPRALAALGALLPGELEVVIK